MTIRAQGDFDRVEVQPFPAVQDTTRCAQSQAEILPMARPAEVPLLRFRKGYCEILGARVGGSRGDYRQAAQDFAQAMAAWPARGIEPMSAGLQVLSAVARLQAGAAFAEVKPGLEEAARSRTCPAGVMSPRICEDLLRTGRLWQGWIALKEGDLASARGIFAAFPDLAWGSWAAGLAAEKAGRYAEAVDAMGKAVEAWSLDQRYPKPGLMHILGPAPDVPAATAQLGEAQYLAGKYGLAIASLDAAVRAQPEDAMAIFVRGLAREATGRSDAAMNDYQAASRTAFAHPDRPFSAGQAHLYRGVWHFRRKAWAQAEDEFAGALNADPGPELRADAAAWRQLAAVAGGSCQRADDDLRVALAAASGFFPRAEAEKVLAACGDQPRDISLK